MRRRRRAYSTEPLECRILLTALDVRQVAKFFPEPVPETLTSDFGVKVAVDGKTAVIVASNAASASSDKRTGAAYVFKLNDHNSQDISDDTWDYAATLSSPRITPREVFGWSVAIQGSTIAISCSNLNEGGNHCLIFSEPVGGWQGQIQEAAQLLPPEDTSLDHSGLGTGLTIDGDSIVVSGVSTKEYSEGIVQGYVFARPSSGWNGQIRPSATLVMPRITGESATMVRKPLGVDAVAGTIAMARLVEEFSSDFSRVSFARSVSIFQKPVAGWSGIVTPLTTIDQPFQTHTFSITAPYPLSSVGATSTVAIGNRFIAIGMPEYERGTAKPGVVAVYTQPTGGWGTAVPSRSLLVPSAENTTAIFGVNVWADGNSVATLSENGRTFIFSRDASFGWSAEQTENVQLEDPQQELHFRGGIDFSEEFLLSGILNPTSGVLVNSQVSIYRRPTTGWSSNGQNPLRPQWSIQQPDLGNNLLPNDVRFGEVVAIDNEYAVMTSVDWQSSEGKMVRSVTVVKRSANTWRNVAHLEVRSGSMSVLSRSLAIDGNTVVARGVRPDGHEGLFVWEQPLDGWSGVVHETAFLSGPQGVTWFGDSIDIDGNTIVAASLTGSGDALNPVAVFEKRGVHWTDQAEPSALLLPQNRQANPNFGSSVAIDNGTIVVSSTNSIYGAGTQFEPEVYVFQRPAPGWNGTLSESARLMVPALVPNNPGGGGGLPVAISGEVIAVQLNYSFQGREENNRRTEALVFDRSGLGWSGSVASTGRLLMPVLPFPTSYNSLDAPIRFDRDRILLGNAGAIFNKLETGWIGSLENYWDIGIRSTNIDLSGSMVITGDPIDSEFAVEHGSATIYLLSSSLDLGDAPDSYETRRATGASGGARHEATGPMLGVQRDSELDAAEALDGTSDDSIETGATGIDDEDGILLSSVMMGQPTTVSVVISGGSGRFYGWVDFNRDGDFADPGEKVFDGSQLLDSGSQDLTFQTPANAVAGESYARFRLSTDTGLSWSGMAADGEVEDYRIQIQDFVPVVLKPLPVEISNRPLFEWNPIPGINNFEIWLLHLPTNTTIHRSTRVQSNVFRPALPLPIGNYSFWVRSVGANGTVSAWSQVKSFRIATPVSLLTEPERHMVNPTFRWSPLLGAASYDFWLSNVTTDERVYLKEAIPESQTTLSLPFALSTGQYRYWVRGRDKAGVAANWSEAKTFDIGLRTNPTEFSTFEANPTVSWIGNPAMDAYEIYLSRGSIVVQNTMVTSTSWTSTSALAPDTYRFWVRGRMKANGKLTPWSSVVEFKTGGQTVLMPTQNGSTSRPLVSWRPVIQAKSYRVQIVNKSNSNIVLDQSGISGTQYQVSSILPDSSYRIWTRAESTTGQLGVWSAPMDFSIASASSTAAVTQSLPRWSADRIPFFEWQGVGGALSFDYYLTNGNQVFAAEAVASRSFLPSAPLEFGNWMMWVRARDAANRTGAWSLPEGVTVGRAPSLNVVNASNGSVSEIRWLSVFGATKYEVYIQNQSSGQVSRITDVTLRNYSPKGTLSAGRYRVWVRAVHLASVFGPWSEPADFRIL